MIPQSNLHLFPDVNLLVQDVAARWSRISELSDHSPFAMAFSGGRVSGRLLSEMAALSLQLNLDLSRTDFFWTDERLVPPSDPESNFRSADELFFKPLAINPSRIHRIKGELSSEEALVDINPHLPIHGRLGLVFLGMGEDGHVASLFPGQEVENPRSEPFVFVTGPKPPPRRITMTFETILAAKRIWVLITGDGKEQAWQNSLKGSTPLGKILKARNDVDVFRELKE